MLDHRRIVLAVRVAVCGSLDLEDRLQREKPHQERRRTVGSLDRLIVGMTSPMASTFGLSLSKMSTILNYCLSVDDQVASNGISLCTRTYTRCTEHGLPEVGVLKMHT